MRRIGSVRYVNAKPLISRFETEGAESGVELIEDVPSRLPALLEAGEVEAILVSSAYALTEPGRRIAEGCVIATYGAAQSVRLFSQVPLSEIRSLALDASSLTSNLLCRLVLDARYGARPEFETMPADLGRMLAGHDAALIMGDAGMLASHSALIEADLGLEWTEMTGLPFVWAVWAGDERLSSSLVGSLVSARDWGLLRLPEIVSACERLPGWGDGVARRYLSETMHYRMGEGDLAGLRLFREMVSERGWCSAGGFPELVRAEAVGV